MRMSYDRGSDILILETSDEQIDHAEEVDSIIVHLSKENKPVLLEILDASEFLSAVAKIGMRSKEEELIELSI